MSTEMYRSVHWAPVATTRPFGGALEHHDAGLDVMMDREVVTSFEDDHGAVRAVELGDGRAALDATGDPRLQASRNGGRNRRSAIAQAPAAGSASTV
jgi:hypothetical protein